MSVLCCFALNYSKFQLDFAINVVMRKPKKSFSNVGIGYVIHGLVKIARAY